MQSPRIEERVLVMKKSAGALGRKGKQLSVFLDDTPGTLGRVACLLGDRGINILALTLAEGLEHGYVRMVVDRLEEAARLLDENGYLFFEREVLLLELANEPGALGRAATRWGEAGINLEYAYCAASPGLDRGLVVVKVDQLDRALELLSDLA